MLHVVEEVLVGRKRRLEAQGMKAEGFVFPGVGKDRRGKRAAVAGDRHIKANSFSQRFRRLVERCVKLNLIEKEKAGERLVLYSSRHTRITEMVAAGLPAKVVMDEAGHKVPTTTNRYTHLADEFVTETVRKQAGRQVGGSYGDAG
jgi:integrase